MTMRILGLVAVLLLAAGCSTFQRAWREAEQTPIPANDIAGRWEGTWQNTNNTHCDRLRGILTRVSATEYHARFHAKYKKILSFNYQATFTGAWSADGGEFQFRGDENLGALAGGRFKYEGRASPTNFFSTYDSKYDVGTFTMRRPSN